MASIDLRIRPLNIIFTPCLTTIGESLSIPSTAHLRIQVTPTHNGKNIAHIKVWYFDPNSTPSRFNEEIKDDDMFRSIAHTMADTLCHDTLIDQISTYMRTLPHDEVSVIMKEYTKYIENGILLDGFIAGIASYLVFLLLNENSIFMNQMLFQLTIPCNISDGNTLTRNMFQYLSLPLSALSKISHGVLLQLVMFIQSFINIWEPAFGNGPCIGSNNEAKICMEVISGLANDATSKLARVQSEHNAMMTTLNNVESRLKATIDESLANMRREINNLIVEAQSSVKDLSSHVIKQLDIVDGRIEEAVSTIDHTIKRRIGKIIEDELDDQIKQKIRLEIEETQGRIEEIVAHYTMKEGKKIVREAVNERESQIQGTLIGLEHRIEILYNKLSTGSGEKTIITENNDDDKNRDVGSPTTRLAPIEFTTMAEINSNVARESNSPSKVVRGDSDVTRAKYQSRNSTKDLTDRVQEIPRGSQLGVSPTINEERPVNSIAGNVSLAITPIDERFDNPIIAENIATPDKVNEYNTNGVERSLARETININPKRRLPIVRGKTDSNPTSLSEPGANSVPNWYGPWNSRRITPP